MFDGTRVASFRHPGPAEAAREFAEDAIRRHHAEYARIIERKTKTVEMWPCQQSGEHPHAIGMTAK